MPSNVIIFDAEYIAELVSRMNIACELMAEAVTSLKKASMHEGWKCKECARISENIDDLNIRLGKLDEGVNETTRVLGGSVSRFAELESKYESQANGLSEDLRANYGFSASVRPGSSNPQPSGSREIHGGRDSNSPGHAHAAGGASGAAGSVAGRAGRFFDRRNNINVNITNNNPDGQNQIVNLPVTHIPDMPDAAAKGIKDTRAIQEAAVQGTSESIAKILGRDKNVIISNPGHVAQHIAATYNAGKIVSENSAVIMSSPSMPHTQERLAMAAGLATLAGGASASLGMMAGNAKLAANPNAVESGNVKDNAKNLIPEIEGKENSEEIHNVLSSIANEEPQASINTNINSYANSNSQQEAEDDSFFGKIMKSLKEKINEQWTAQKNAELSQFDVSSLPEPAQEFLAKVM